MDPETHAFGSGDMQSVDVILTPAVMECRGDDGLERGSQRVLMLKDRR